MQIVYTISQQYYIIELMTPTKNLSKRPLIITFYCILNVIIAIPALFFIIFLVIIFPDFVLEFSQTHGKIFFFNLLAISILLLVTTVGLWRMKKWGLYLYLLSMVIGILINIITKINYNIVGYITTTITLIIFFYNFKKFK